MRIRPFWTSLYVLWMLCFFFIGVGVSSYAWVGFFILPFVLNVLYGYFRKVTGEAFSTVAFGLVLYALIVVISMCMLSTLEPFWVHLENWWLPGIETFEEALSTAAILFTGLLPIQFPWAILGILTGIGAEKLVEMLRPTVERTDA